ncbi:hypothetical protein K431DRAFT_287384 [Polychaeton citri CBS 116435]|uniref:Uncharacterized protein n=1 Tax=Polychaeton citri CBS 116435 TaxID=1314669 RepID=A0A9P4UK87_9PEZI|nr:hypothetical protein K431DRAFT_287384 [Polychaeton citri CBS 116435]
MGRLVVEITADSGPQPAMPDEGDDRIGQLPKQLIDHATICFEEQLYFQAFAILFRNLPQCLPPPRFLTLAATLVVHPSLTTRTNSAEKHAASDHALEYFRHVARLGAASGTVDGGCVGTELSSALQFANGLTSRTARIRYRQRSGNQSSPNASDGEATPPSSRINLSFAGAESLYAKAEDFWRVVGWAFTCSAVHRARWQRWKLWLELVIAFLEDDLASCAAGVGGRAVEDALLTQYVAQFKDGGRSSRKAIMRAIFADGSDKSRSEFTEIWRNETRPPKKDKFDEKRPIRKRERLDIDQDNYGDYYEDSDQDSDLDPVAVIQPEQAPRPVGRPKRKLKPPPEQSSGKQSTTHTDTKADPSTATTSALASFGNIESLHLRHNLLGLLARYCSNHPGNLCDIQDLLGLYTEFLRPLPISLFQHFLLPTRRYLDMHAQSTLDQTLLQPLIVTSAPRYRENELTQADFERHFAPFPANSSSVTENAKVSLLVEDLLRLLWRSGWLEWTSVLESAVEKGIEARKMKASSDGRRKGVVELDAMAILDESARRMRICISILPGGDGRAKQARKARKAT